MAAALTNHQALCFVSRPVPYQWQNRMSKPVSKACIPIRQNPNFNRFSDGLLVSKLSRRTLVAVGKVAETNPTTINGDQGYLQDMKELINSYKTAILDGDVQSISELETIINTVETSKNDLSTKLSNMITEIATGKDKFLRLSAEFDNFRKKIEKDRLRLSSDIQVDVVENLLPIIDSFENVKLEEVPETEKETIIGTSYQGIYKQFVETLRSLGVGVVETVGKPFDPSVHEAIGREESEEFKAGIVCLEINRGFLHKGRVIRHAKVKVSNGPGSTKTQPASDQHDEVISDHAENSTSES